MSNSSQYYKNPNFLAKICDKFDNIHDEWTTLKQSEESNELGLLRIEVRMLDQIKAFEKYGGQKGFLKLPIERPQKRVNEYLASTGTWDYPEPPAPKKAYSSMFSGIHDFVSIKCEEEDETTPPASPSWLQERLAAHKDAEKAMKLVALYMAKK